MMGRRIEMKKIQDTTKCQVTFSKRRSSLIKKAEEISIACDVKVAFLAFSPSGRISKFCNPERMEDLLDCYVNLPVDKRLSHLKNVQEKMEKLQELGTIRDEGGKLNYLNYQIENLKVQIEKNQIEVQLAEANLRDFVLNPTQEASLHQLLWCERNLQQSIEKVEEKKKEKLLMEKEGAVPWSFNRGGNNLHFAGSNSCNGQLQMQSKSWRNNQYIARYPENIFDEMLGKGKGKEVADAYGGWATTMQNHTFSASIPTSYDYMHQLGVPETQTGSSYISLQNNNYNAQTPSSYAMNQPEIALAAKNSNELTYAPSQVNLNHGYLQQYAQDYPFDMDCQLWKETPMPWQQAESNFSFGNFAGESSNFAENYFSDNPSAFPQSNSNNITNTLADASNYWEISMLQNQPNTVLNHMDMNANEERNENNNQNEENEDAYNDMIVSPPPSVQAPPSASEVPSDLYDFFSSEDPLGDNASWPQEI